MSPPTDIELPGVLGEIARLVGNGAALMVAHVRGGHERVYFPRPANLGRGAGRWLVEAVGIDAATVIARELGGCHITVPLGPFSGVLARTRLTMIKALEAGKSPAEAARLAGLHQRTARRHKSRIAPPVNDLFTR